MNDSMTMNIRPLALALLLVGLLGVWVVPIAHALEPVNTGLFNNVALKGYDPVAYFEDGKPVAGSKKFTHEHDGAQWRFASADHRDKFAAEPAAYTPQYGGYCAWAVSQGSTASIDPDAWKIVDGKLYLNYSLEIQERWDKDHASLIEAADEIWPKLLGE